MRIFLNVIAVLMLGVGGVWTLQGLNILLGSFMSGSREWLIIGVVLVLIGAVVLIFANRRRKTTPPE